jgi:ubiquinone/menaquinone biosynthesis C-methylase UbiE
MSISFWDYVSLGRPQWRGESSAAKAAFFFVLGSPDTHSRIRNTHVLNLIQKLPIPEKAQVLELGSGRGVSLFWLARNHPDWKLTGIDLDTEMATMSERAARKGGWDNLKFKVGAAEELMAKQQYDLIICIDALEHISDDLGLLVKIREALRPGGFVVLHVPRRRHHQWRWIKAFSEHTVDGHVGEEYEEDEFRQLIERAGFRIREFRQTFGRWGEVSFELNMLMWKKRWLRNILALLTYPVAVPIGYADTRRPPDRGNAFLAAAQPRDLEDSV